MKLKLTKVADVVHSAPCRLPAFWLEEHNDEEAFAVLSKFALDHAHLGGPTGRDISILIKNRDFAGLCDFELDYSRLSVAEAAHCRQALGFFSKNKAVVLEGRPAPKETARRKFLEAEASCQKTNELFRLREQGLFNFEPWVDAALSRARSKISRVLGELPKLSDLDLRFGPGATTLTKKKNASVVEKLQAGFSCSETLVPHLRAVLDQMPALRDLHAVAGEWEKIEPVSFQKFCKVNSWWDLEEKISTQVVFDVDANYDKPMDHAERLFSTIKRGLELREHFYQVYLNGVDAENAARYEAAGGYVPVLITDGIVEFVPKNAKTDRAIVKEGSLNTMVQLALGDYMTRRLLAFGIDIKDQEVNKALALLGSLTGGLGTLDLSSASDMIAYMLVLELLPFHWAFMLDSCRSETVVLEGQAIKLEKFSSMGNGYTFPLETLIFWALATSVSDTEYASVYGDDIIVKTEDVERVMRLLEIVGFQINQTKSYWTGSFRESCGGDYLRGIDIRPYYQKELLTPAELFKLHNFYVRKGEMEFAETVRLHIHPCLHLYGPDGYGDGHLIGPFPKKRSKRHTSNGYAGATFDTFTRGPVRDRRQKRLGDRVLPVYSIYRRDAGEPVQLPTDPLRRRDLHRNRNNAGQLRVAGEPLPERVSPVDGVSYKEPSYPGSEGYRRISIYTL